MDTNPLFTAALGLVPPWRVNKCDFHPEQRQLELSVDFTSGAKFSCPECGAKDCAVHDTVEKRWRHLDFFQHQAYIVARVPRVNCTTCGVRLLSVPWARPGSGFTLLMEGLILEMARVMPVRNIAQLLRVSDNRMWRVIHHYVGEAVDRMDCSGVTSIGVDETAMLKRHDYISVFYDLEAKRLLFATAGREQKTVAAFARFIDAHNGNSSAIANVSCDMSPAFIKGVKQSLPSANVTFDRFHVAKLLSDAVERVRRSESRADKTIKGGRYALLKRPENLSERQRQQLTDITTRNKNLAEAYRLKETFRDFYQQPDITTARGFLKAWIIAAQQSTIKPIVTAAYTIWQRAGGILRWHSTRITNAVVEGLNSLLQAAKRKARGYRLHETFITIAYLIAGKLDLRYQSPLSMKR